MKQEQEIFEQAIALASREAREGFLLGACGQNRELRKSVDELIAAFDDAGKLDFLLGISERTVERAWRFARAWLPAEFSEP